MDNLLVDALFLGDNATKTISSSTPEVTSTPPPEFPDYVGFICCGISVLFFGSNFIPVKQFKTGDGQIEAPVLFALYRCPPILSCLPIPSALT